MRNALDLGVLRSVLRRRPRTMKTRMKVTVATTTDESADDGVETGSEGDYVPEDHEPEDLDLFDPNDPLETEKRRENNPQ